MAIGSMPGWIQNRRSSAATVADTRTGGKVVAVRLMFRVPSSDSASYRGIPLRSTTEVDVAARVSSRPAGIGPSRIQSAIPAVTVERIASCTSLFRLKAEATVFVRNFRLKAEATVFVRNFRLKAEATSFVGNRSTLIDKTLTKNTLANICGF